MSKEYLITVIAERISAEYRKHKAILDWPRIAAIKIVHMLEELEKPNIKLVKSNDLSDEIGIGDFDGGDFYKD